MKNLDKGRWTISNKEEQDKEKTGHTLQEVGDEFGVTRERIRQIQAKALTKLRHSSVSKKLNFMEE